MNTFFPSKDNKKPFVLFFLLLAGGLAASDQAFEFSDSAAAFSPFLLSEGRLTPAQLGRYLLSNNPKLEASEAAELARLYVVEAALEGVNHDIAFVQMLLETGYLKFGGQVSRDQNNFCGLGALDGGDPGLWFNSMQEGVRAHIQHLKAYGGESELVMPLGNPRFRFVRRGSSPTYHELAGRWASDRRYGEKIHQMLAKLYEWSLHP